MDGVINEHERTRKTASYTRVCVKVISKRATKAIKANEGLTNTCVFHGKEAFDLVANEIKRVHKSYGPQSIYGGSYGWFCVGSLNNPPALVTYA